MLYQLINVDEAEQFITLKLWIHMVKPKKFACFPLPSIFRKKPKFLKLIGPSKNISTVFSMFQNVTEKYCLHPA